MSDEKTTGLKRVARACGHSMRGIKYAWNNEAAFRQEIIGSIILLPIVFILELSNVERALLVLTIFIILIAEIINSAIEAVVDRVGLEHHSLSGAAKDMGSAAVGLGFILFIIVWSIILLF